MRVQKIIQANPEIFKSDPHKNYSELEAILKVAAVECQGNEVQKLDFELRQTYLAICNLIHLGFHDTATELAKDLIPRAEMAQHYKIAQGLCEILIIHFYQLGDLETIDIYKSLYDKYAANISLEHQSMLLYGRSIHNFKNAMPFDTSKIQLLIDAIEEKLPFDSLMYHYYYFQYKSLLVQGERLEQLYIEAIAYFQNLHFNHTFLSSIFIEGLIAFYLDNHQFEKVEYYLRLLDIGSMTWFRSYLKYVQILIKLKDIKSNDLCNLTMNHENFAQLPFELKNNWKVAYKAAVRLMLENP